MSRTSGTLGGAASGAAAGSALGPWGAAAGGVLGGLAGYFGSGNDDAVKQAQEAKVAADRKAAADYLAYRDTVAQAHTNATAAQESFFDQNSNMLNSMNGGQGAPDIAGGVYKSPIQADGMKLATAPDTAPKFAPNTPMPAPNTPQQFSYAPPRPQQ